MPECTMGRIVQVLVNQEKWHWALLPAGLCINLHIHCILCQYMYHKGSLSTWNIVIWRLYKSFWVLWWMIFGGKNSTQVACNCWSLQLWSHHSLLSVSWHELRVAYGIIHGSFCTRLLSGDNWLPKLAHSNTSSLWCPLLLIIDGSLISKDSQGERPLQTVISPFIMAIEKEIYYWSNLTWRQTK